MNDVFHAKTKLIDIQNGEELNVIINEEQARQHGISALDKVILRYKDKEIVLNADLSHKYVKHGEIWLYKDVFTKYKIPADAIVSVHFTQTNGKAIDALKKAINGGTLNYKETYAIMKDIAENRFTDTLITYYSALGFFKKASDHELYEMAKAMAETGEMLHFDW